MLILARRPDEKIVFPSIGVTLHVLRIQGNAVRIGIDAPRSLEILREELVGTPSPSHRSIETPAARARTHELCNRLSRVTLGLHLFEKQRAAGLQAEADATLSAVFKSLEDLDRDWITENFDIPVPVPKSVKKLVCRALIVEDDENERELLAGVLKMNGCQCDTAADGLLALEYLASHQRPDFILLDMSMPRCDGPETLRSIRANPLCDGVKVFSVSSSSPSSLSIPTGPSGVEMWFPKPLNPGRLWETIQHCILHTSSN